MIIHNLICIFFVIIKFSNSLNVNPMISNNPFLNVARLYVEEYNSNTAEDIYNNLSSSHVMIIGLGGVGSWAVEALARSGIGKLTLVDADDICVSNINRQLMAVRSTIGEMKADSLKSRILDINPNCIVNNIYEFVTKNTAERIILDYSKNENDNDNGYSYGNSDSNSNSNIGDKGYGKPDLVLEIVDSVVDKAAIMSVCSHHSIPIITCGGAGDLKTPDTLIVSDVARCYGDMLIQKTRKLLRKEYNFPKGRPLPAKRPDKKFNIPCVHTIPINQKRGINTIDSDRSSSGFRACDVHLGNACFVTGSMGFMMASIAVKAIATQKLQVPVSTKFIATTTTTTTTTTPVEEEQI